MVMTAAGSAYAIAAVGRSHVAAVPVFATAVGRHIAGVVNRLGLKVQVTGRALK